ncbi:MAG TPA: MBL fold metallo-hydrolase [bacterium]|nr:MBL fold metallo-hydrolase [bacterium]
MKVTLWGTRGSLATAGPETVRYGGNTSCVEVRGADGTLLVLDAGTGIQRLNAGVGGITSVDVLLTHLHMDHLQGLGFFAPLYRPEVHVHIWGPASTTMDLQRRLVRYLSPPLFPVRLRELPCSLTLHDVPLGTFTIGGLAVTAALVSHPGPTVGYRVVEGGIALAYLPDHEPALGVRDFPAEPSWTSGFDLAAGADLLIHDVQFTDEEYPQYVGWGHSSIGQALAFARLAGVKRLVPFHHSPAHTDADLDRLLEQTRAREHPFAILPGKEGLTIEL